MVKPYVKWTKEMVDFVRVHDNFSDREVAEILKVNIYSVQNARRRHKIRKKLGVALKRLYKENKLIPPNKGKKLAYLRKRNLENNPMNNPLVREKARQTKIRNLKEGKTKLWNKGLRGEEYLKHYKDGATWLIIAQRDKEVKRKHTEKNLRTKIENNSMPKGKDHAWYGKTKYNYEPCRRASERMKAGGALKARKANNFRPNKVEAILINLIRENNLPFNYVGDGKFWLKGEKHSFNPDFVSENSKHIIEIFGNYWHNLSRIKIRDEERLRTFQNQGYKTLIIWEKELRNLDNVKEKINNFAET